MASRSRTRASRAGSSTSVAAVTGLAGRTAFMPTGFMPTGFMPPPGRRRARPTARPAAARTVGTTARYRAGPGLAALQGRGQPGLRAQLPGQTQVKGGGDDVGIQPGRCGAADDDPHVRAAVSYTH